MNYLTTKLEEQVGSTITKSSAGGSVGTIWKIELDNGSFFVINCTWRLFKEMRIFMTSQDSVAPDGLISKTTPILNGEKIEKIVLQNNHDICINISNGFKLDVFCDIGIGFEWYSDPTNWDLCIPPQDKAISINNNLEMFEEKYY